ncbi:MAG: hypothetical protein LBG60_17340, partial [Bifidobacteriaceae bacterium]|nr:hypothetical protein [Bifidobacteriaceae bacterium]
MSGSQSNAPLTRRALREAAQEEARRTGQLPAVPAQDPAADAVVAAPAPSVFWALAHPGSPVRKPPVPPRPAAGTAGRADAAARGAPASPSFASPVAPPTSSPDAFPSGDAARAAPPRATGARADAAPATSFFAAR